MGTINNLEQESDLEKYLNDIEDVTKVENITSKEKEEESNVHIKLKQEIKDHNETKKSLKALEVEYNKCKTELRVVNEEKERLKIEGNDLKKVNSVTKNSQRDQSKAKSDPIMLCAICEYPFKSSTDLINHQSKHKAKTAEVIMAQNCGICGFEYNSNNELRKHIIMKHSTQHNCTLCSFQGSSNIILIKHTNVTHKNANEQESGTFRCNKCEKQYSSKWNLNNHIRDEHEKLKICE